jgi:hypothetical protein
MRTPSRTAGLLLAGAGLLAGAALLAGVAPALAQEAPPAAPPVAKAPEDPQQAALRKKYEDKIAEAWFKDGGWTDDFDAARARARAEKKPIVGYFSRSYSP